MNFNLVVLMGNLTRDPEVRYTSKGTAVASAGIAVNKRWAGEDGQPRESVSFFDVTAFGRTAEVLSERCRKGDPVLVSGELKQESWEDKQTGAKRTAVKVVAREIQLLGARREEPQGAEHPPRTGQPPPRLDTAEKDTGMKAGDVDPDEDLPF